MCGLGFFSYDGSSRYWVIKMKKLFLFFWKKKGIGIGFQLPQFGFQGRHGKLKTSPWKWSWQLKKDQETSEKTGSMEHLWIRWGWEIIHACSRWLLLATRPQDISFPRVWAPRNNELIPLAHNLAEPFKGHFVCKPHFLLTFKNCLLTILKLLKTFRMTNLKSHQIQTCSWYQLIPVPRTWHKTSETLKEIFEEWSQKIVTIMSTLSIMMSFLWIYNV